MASRKTWKKGDLIPLCHPLGLDAVVTITPCEPDREDSGDNHHAGAYRVKWKVDREAQMPP